MSDRIQSGRFRFEMALMCYQVDLKSEFARRRGSRRLEVE